jgi:hypothetical protein
MTLLAVERTRERSGRAVSERSDSPPYQVISHGVLPMASAPCEWLSRRPCCLVLPLRRRLHEFF